MFSLLYDDFILVIVCGFMLLFDFSILFMYSIPSILLDEFNILDKSSLFISIILLLFI